jgi:uncharacterized protein
MRQRAATVRYMYSNGQGVPQNYLAAMTWYRKAADQGLAVAQYWLAFIFDGQGMPQDHAAAMRLFQKAADQGYGPGQYSLAEWHGRVAGLCYSAPVVQLGSRGRRQTRDKRSG